jgi:hypothetical protein
MERLRLETRGEFFNALNHTNLGTPNRFVNTAAELEREGGNMKRNRLIGVAESAPQGL